MAWKDAFSGTLLERMDASGPSKLATVGVVRRARARVVVATALDHCFAETAGAEAMLDDQTLRRVLEVMDARPDTSLSVAELSRGARLSPSRFSR